MIDRYKHTSIEKIFSPKNRFSVFLKIEKLCALQIKGLSDKDSSELYDSIANIDLDVLVQDTLVYEKETRHETTAFIKAMLKQTPKKFSPYIHRGLTSSDILDTCLSIQIRDSLEVILNEISSLKDAMENLISKHKYTYILGRSHGRGGELTSFGLVVLGFYAELLRDEKRITDAHKEISFGCISGPMGNYTLIDPDIERQVCKSLGLSLEPVSTQVIPRDRHAYCMSMLGLLGGFLDRLSIEIRNLSQTGIDELSESFIFGQHGSSAMPHKRNPILSENISGLTRVIKANVAPSLENISLWYERDMSHSSVERIIIEDSLHLVAFGLKRMCNVLRNLYVNSDKMMLNIKNEKGSYFSHSVLFFLMSKGLGREASYEVVQELVKENKDLILTLNSLGHFSEIELSTLLDVSRFHSKVDLIYSRFF